MEIEITWKRAAKVWWAYFWRSLVIQMPLLFIFNIVKGFRYQIGTDGNLIFSLIFLVIYVIIIIMMTVYPIKMILGKDFGEFRLLLVKTTHAKEIKVTENDIRYF